MKKLLLTTALGLCAMGIAATPALADHHMDDKPYKPGKHKMFEKMDADGDGVISKAEFIQAHEKRFNELDADGNGTISKEEAKAKRQEMHKKMKKRMEARKKKTEEAE
jgi:Ca2+-binding EF-hand superfamily protein